MLSPADHNLQLTASIDDRSTLTRALAPCLPRQWLRAYTPEAVYIYPHPKADYRTSVHCSVSHYCFAIV